LADYREATSAVARELKRYECKVTYHVLSIADYLLSDRVAVERKTVRDFLHSLIDHRLFAQVKALKKAYKRPILILEGHPYELYSTEIHVNAIRGALASLSIDYEIPILWSRDSCDTAGILVQIAQREQVEQKRELVIRRKTRTEGLREQQEYLIAGLPGVSTKLSRLLLKHFGCPEKVFTATSDELQKVRGIGKIMAKRIRKIIESHYSFSV
jgi:Fanconi anemia group M protein